MAVDANGRHLGRNHGAAEADDQIGDARKAMRLDLEGSRNRLRENRVPDLSVWPDLSV